MIKEKEGKNQRMRAAEAAPGMRTGLRSAGQLGHGVRIGKRAFCLFLAGALAVGNPAAAYAMPPYDTIPEGVSEERYARMQDNLIEWEELDDLVRYYNPMISRLYDTATGGINDMKASYGQQVMDAKENLDELDSLIDGMEAKLAQLGNGTGAAAEMIRQQLAAAKVLRQTLKQGLSGAKRGFDRADKSVEIKLHPYRKQMVSVMQGLLFQYHQLAVSASMAEEQVSLYRTLYETQSAMLAQNLVTESEVQAAKNKLDAAEKSLRDVRNGEQQLAQAIGLQLGWAAGNVPEIGALPEPDVHYAEGRDLAADKTQAIAVNAAVHEAGVVGGKHSAFDFTLRDLTENEAKGKLDAKMDVLYAALLEKQALYEASLTTLERARLTKEGAERQYALGLLGRAEYETKQMEYIGYEASAKLAGLNLGQAICNYQWALDGVVSLE